MTLRRRHFPTGGCTLPSLVWVKCGSLPASILHPHLHVGTSAHPHFTPARYSEPISGLTACVNAAPGRCCKHGRRWTTAAISQVMTDTSLVSGGVDCRRERRKVYDKKPQHYTKDNRTAHLTIVHTVMNLGPYVTNNKRLYSTFCTVEANYWQTRNMARPFCDSRATCFHKWPAPIPEARVTHRFLRDSHTLYGSKLWKSIELAKLVPSTVC